jgi:hypothetical protein
VNKLVVKTDCQQTDHEEQQQYFQKYTRKRDLLRKKRNVENNKLAQVSYGVQLSSIKAVLPSLSGATRSNPHPLETSLKRLVQRLRRDQMTCSSGTVDDRAG